ncbi:MAG: hypothetical protein H0U79_05745 [Solirubrobacterales bacterium]|nr:hypothetical protein [Solirubrobacterales bacterium]
MSGPGGRVYVAPGVAYRSGDAPPPVRKAAGCLKVSALKEEDDVRVMTAFNRMLDLPGRR